MMERRKSGRMPVDAPVAVSVGDIEIRSRLCNISEQGALFRIDEADAEALSNDDLVETIRFQYDGFTSPDGSYTGEVARFFGGGGDRYLAVRFFKQGG